MDDSTDTMSKATEESDGDAPGFDSETNPENGEHENGEQGNGTGAGFGSGFDGPKMAVDPALYPDLTQAQAAPGEPRDLRLLSDIELELCVEIGRARLPLRQLLALTPGSVVELDRALGEPVDVLVNGTLVGRGQIVTIGDEFGVRLSEIVDPSNGGPPARRRS